MFSCIIQHSLPLTKSTLAQGNALNDPPFQKSLNPRPCCTQGGTQWCKQSWFSMKIH